MPIILEEVKISGHPGPVEIFKVTPNSWKVLKCFSSTTPKANLHEDIKNLQPSDKAKAKNLFTVLGQKCEPGTPLNEMYDKKKLHCALEFSYKNKKGEHVIDNVWRIRQDELRLYFIYLHEKTIVLLHLWYKREDDLSASEKKQLGKLAEAILLQVEAENDKRKS
ncbi:hypothetical protein [Salmonella enterica]|jgi:mRNA-degrading endonuclease RelE of RelBE toxin-antitoxin system|uniref:hypothetical protein n=1 Tax=Salmonella enterica TaxID=28901 RepID=UPI0010A93E74|nr:hypothetical protein [Salmonella enterica]ECN4718899.1 hypothetical protein [Salmonella enterica subsp. enterica serovar Typhimurium]EDS5735658.1 hypothetical protein [Salmonella enterica subsp. enterica]EEH3855485.1 hypothetical protein [Salmonella enterica subsp. enterica serovar 4,[5],12:i:-]HBR1942533.1 hypothetical protein [Klebsiella pneumoniae]EAW6366324.1 hypothetical protein [Salmonella enterica]